MTRRIAPALGLFFLAPLVAEFLLGNLPITLLPAVIALAPMYGGGALLIRELVRRRGLGWPSILVLGVAYGVLEEGLTTQSLFNPGYADQHLLTEGFVPALGISVPWTLYVIGLHVFWSVGAPILMTEAIARDRRTTPWLGRTGLIVTGVLFAAGIATTTAITMAMWPYTATPGQFAGTGVVLALLVAGGLLPLRFRGRDGRPPRARTVLATTLLAGAFFQGLTLAELPTWLTITVWVADVTVYLTLIARWSARTGWADRHRLAVGAGALLTYAWHSFVETPTGAAEAWIDLIGNAVFAAGAAGLIWFAARRLRAGEISAMPDRRSMAEAPRRAVR
ncbi:hypothetical protein Aab01nite_01010 [Paractinoplanes abujensis]|uniref:Uncharacterized protein n=1 Tax=Paractinoplanes abujensis TaxID=882441 RepID=A0A7W7CRR8_9ACTN|nr:hypothetical protein [Actinoplanes abujensis]MBB4692073.1 hypothetical protein [Actinoplanes abujensis]GID16511.1 hypothetical protein Aab01nite_01010 [Actinoplanes abujensis]